jgi:hypothetical protein
MTLMKKYLLAAAALVALASQASAGTVLSAQEDADTYRPIQSIRYDFGSKSMSGYFVQQAVRCVMMLMVSERGDQDTAPSGTATRVRLVLNPGQIAGLDSEEGRSINLTCGEGAQTLRVEVGDRNRLIELQGMTVRS